ncbi:MAG: cob(I)yrinic acid a,c-diamide adenosyltransferase, partial [Patescibacteria group bacterium]|nr:cob(I)yrinic acid a,c-diamide adenosyltransferase [Patescibacteria group bacterium]
ETYGTVDELNSMLGAAASFTTEETVRAMVATIQKDLLDIGSHLANPGKKISEGFALYLEERITTFEKTIDEQSAQMPDLMQFILPSGGHAGTLFHVARTVCRRAERRIVELAEKEQTDGLLVKYLNRLSDLLFSTSRFVNCKEKQKEIVWTAFEQ